MFFKLNMSIDSSIFNTEPYYPSSIKRKRFSHYENNINSEDDDCTNDGSESESSSNSNISLSPFVNIVRHGHKVLITEQQYFNSNSQVEVEMDKCDSPISSIEEDQEEFNLSTDEETNNEGDSSFVFSTTLKTKLQELNNEDNLINRLNSETNFYPNSEELQIIPWIPNIPQFEAYDVEEPSDQTNSNQNKLLIEEIFQSDNSFKTSKISTRNFQNFYLVEHDDDYKNFNNLNNNCSSYNITEVQNHSSGFGGNQNQISEESMEF